MMERIKAWARALKRDVIALWLAARDRRVPWHAKAVAGAVAAYALSPINLIPDFIPLIGFLDDLLIVPLGIWVASRFIPASIMAELRMMALQRHKPTSLAGLAVVISIWLASVILIAWLVYPSLIGDS